MLRTEKVLMLKLRLLCMQYSLGLDDLRINTALGYAGQVNDPLATVTDTEENIQSVQFQTLFDFDVDTQVTIITAGFGTANDDGSLPW